MNSIAKSILHDYEQSIGRIILQCIRELPVQFLFSALEAF